MAKRLNEILQEQSEAMFTVLECRPDACGEFKAYTLGLNTNYCIHSISYLRNLYGKAQIFNLCYKEIERHKLDK